MERKPDNNSDCTRYNHVTLGDGMDYRVPVVALGSRGIACLEAIDTIDTGAPKEKMLAAESLFRLCLGLFYSDKTIDALFDKNNVSFDYINALIDAITGELTEKKTSQAKSWTPFNGLCLLLDYVKPGVTRGT